MNNRTETTFFPKTTHVFDRPLDIVAPKGGRGLGDHPSRTHFGSIIKFWLFFFFLFFVHFGFFREHLLGRRRELDAMCIELRGDLVCFIQCFETVLCLEGCNVKGIACLGGGL